MHNAPSVSYPVGRSLFWAGGLAVLWLLGVMAVALWCRESDTMGWRQLCAIVAVVLVGAMGWRSYWCSCTGTLRWDGQQWFWHAKSAEQVPIEIVVPLDLQHHMLVRGAPATGRALWCWVERSAQPTRWRDMRRAVYSPARPQHKLDPIPAAEP